MANEKVVCVVGPTAAGKTAFSIELAKAVDGEVVSADSRQVYRGLDIGTGKVTEAEMHGVPHHMLDVADPQEVFSAADFVRRGREALADIVARGKVPIIAGGTGFYIDALLGRVSLADVPPNPAVRKRLAGYNLGKLQNELQKLDPERYETIDTKNPRRLIRAIEVAHALGKNLHPEHASLYNTLWFGIILPQTKLKERIQARLTARLDAGMLDEAKRLHAEGLAYERMEELGLEYRYMARHLHGDMSFDQMQEQLEREIWKYAKRQMTWFKRNPDIHWLNPSEKEATIARVKMFLA